MEERKQVMDMRSTTSDISQLESDDLQRIWSEEQWKNKAKDSLANYDPTRAALNFEVAKGGVVQPIDRSKSIAQKMAENLAARGREDLMLTPEMQARIKEAGKETTFFSRRNAAPIVVYAATEEDFPSREELMAIQRGIEGIKAGRTFKMGKGESLDDFLNRIESECNV
jgi:hypothetical protein